MPDASAVLTAFRAELVEAELVRRPSEATPAGAPPMHVEPREGAPAPGEREGVEDDPGLVLSLFHGGDLAEDLFDTYRRRTVAEVRYRSATNADLRRAMALDAAVRAHFTGYERQYGTGFTIAGGLFVLSFGVLGGFGPISRSREAGFVNGSRFVLEVAA